MEEILPNLTYGYGERGEILIRGRRYFFVSADHDGWIETNYTDYEREKYTTIKELAEKSGEPEIQEAISGK